LLPRVNEAVQQSLKFDKVYIVIDKAKGTIKVKGRAKRSSVPRSKTDRSRLLDTLRTLYDLLEQYAPSWYTQQHHDKAAAALGIKNAPVIQSSGKRTKRF
jgi:hypothetical protein